MVGKVYSIVWTSEFFEDVVCAVEYVAQVLKAPVAARNMLDGINAKLENMRTMPTAAVMCKGLHGETFYVVSYKSYNIYYIVDHDAIKAVGFKHQSQNTDSYIRKE